MPKNNKKEEEELNTITEPDMEQKLKDIIEKYKNIEKLDPKDINRLDSIFLSDEAPIDAFLIRLFPNADTQIFKMLQQKQYEPLFKKLKNTLLAAKLENKNKKLFDAEQKKQQNLLKLKKQTEQKSNEEQKRLIQEEEQERADYLHEIPAVYDAFNELHSQLQKMHNPATEMATA